MSDNVELSEVVAYIDELLAVRRYVEEPEANGLLVDAARPVMRIAASVNTSFASIRGADEAGAQLLLVHHTTWASIDLHLKAEKEQALRAAGVSLYGAHHSLDCAPEIGTGDSLARLLGVRVEGRLVDLGNGPGGVYGTADGTFESFVEKARHVLGVQVESWENSPAFGRIAIVTGGAPWTSWVNEARDLGCDTYVTGEGSMYTKLFAREVAMNLVLGTHYGTEAPGIKALAESVAGHFALPWSFIKEDPDIL